MENDNNYKEVYFNNYCESCVHKDKAESDEPCDACLQEPVNLHSHKPVKYVAKTE